MPISSTRIRYLDKENKVLVKDFSQIKNSTVLSDIRTPVFLTEEAFADAQNALRQLRSLQTGISSIFAGLSDGSVANAVITNILNNQSLFNSGALANLGPIVNMIKNAPVATVNTLMSAIMSEVTDKLYDNPSLLDDYKKVSKDINAQIVIAALDNFAKKSQAANSNGLSGTTNYLNKLTNSGAINDPSLIAETISAIVTSSGISAGTGNTPVNPDTSGVIVDPYNSGLDNLSKSTEGVTTPTYTKQDQTATLVARTMRSFQHELYYAKIFDYQMYQWFPSPSSVYDFIKKKKTTDLDRIAESVFSWTGVAEYNLTLAYVKAYDAAVYVLSSTLRSLIGDSTATLEDYKLAITFARNVHLSVTKAVGVNYLTVNSWTPSGAYEKKIKEDAASEVNSYKSTSDSNLVSSTKAWRKSELIYALAREAALKPLTPEHVAMFSAMTYSFYFSEILNIYLTFSLTDLKPAMRNFIDMTDSHVIAVTGGKTTNGSDLVYGDERTPIIKVKRYDPWPQLHRFFTFLKEMPTTAYTSSKLKLFEIVSVYLAQEIKSILSDVTNPITIAFNSSTPETFSTTLSATVAQGGIETAKDFVYYDMGLTSWNLEFSPEWWSGTWISPTDQFRFTKNSIVL